MMTVGRIVAWGMVALLCVGCGGGSSSGKKKRSSGKKKKPSASKKYDQAIGDLRVWIGENELDWKGIQEQAAKTRKTVSKSKEHTKDVDDILKAQKEFIQGALVMKIDTIGKEAFDPANEAIWEKKLGEFDTVEKQLAEFDPEIAEANAPKIAEWRGKIVKRVFDKEVVAFARSNRDSVDKVLGVLADWKARVEKLGEAGTPFLEQITAIESTTKELTEWMTRRPNGTIDLLAEANRGAWQKIGKCDLAWEGTELVIIGTGTERKDFGMLLHNGFWWTDYELEIVFENEERGFQLVGRAHPPRSGATQSLSARVFQPERPWSIWMKMQGESMSVGGNVEETTSKFRGDKGGGIGLYVGPGAKVKILKLEAKPLN